MTDNFAGQQSFDILASTEPETKRGPARWFVVGGVVVLVAALIGGISYGAASLSGGGTQPADALPSGAVAFASVDLDPAAGQKVDAIRFLRKFPSLRGHVAEGADLRKVLFDAVADDAGWKNVNFARDVEPWLGQRVGVGFYSPKTLTAKASTGAMQSSSTVVVAMQVGDEGKAMDGLNRLIAASKGAVKPGYVVQDGYALLAESTPIAKTAADLAGKGSMATSKTFAADIKGLDNGIATFWVDSSAASSLLSVADLAGVGLPGIAGAAGAAGAAGQSGKSSALSKARLASSLRFDGPDVLELVGRVSGLPETAGPNVPVKNFAKLPATTVAALGLGGGAGAVDGAWTSLRKTVDSTPAARDSFNGALAQAEQMYGLHLPGDLKLLLGSNFLVALDGTGLGNGDIGVGAKVTTADPKGADKVIGRLTQQLGGFGGPQLTHHATADGYVVASSAAQADRLTQPSAKTLGSVPAFRRALPDVDKARFALWLDVQGVLAGLPAGAAASADLKAISGLGVTTTSDGAGNGTFRLRLVTR